MIMIGNMTYIFVPHGKIFLSFCIYELCYLNLDISSDLYIASSSRNVFFNVYMPLV